jgi:hypothetical protein
VARRVAPVLAPAHTHTDATPDVSTEHTLPDDMI